MRKQHKKGEFKGDHRLCLANTNAVAIVRGSTTDQVNTLAAQEQTLRAYAAMKGLNLLAVIVDSGTSATKVPFFDRPKAMEAIYALQASGGFHILVTKLDRAFRDSIDCGWGCKVLWENHGISVHFTDEGLISSNDRDKMTIQIRASVAEEEGRRRKDRQVDAFDIMRQNHQRCSKTVPFGWRIDPFRNRTTRRGTASNFLLPDDEEQATLAWIFARAQEGFSTGRISSALNQHGIKPKGCVRYLKGGGKMESRGIWYASTVQSVLEHSHLADGTYCLVTNQDGRLHFEFQINPALAVRANEVAA